MLYQNTVGAPYGELSGNFYYDWLMVYGGVFATFPESEHGKTWGEPWSYRVVEDSDDEVAIEVKKKHPPFSPLLLGCLHGYMHIYI